MTQPLPLTQSRRRWVVLAVGVCASAATGSFVYGLAVLLPALRDSEHLSLVGASVVVTAAPVGMLLTLFAFGVAADRYGERVVIATGVGISAVTLAVAGTVDGGVLLLSILLGGAGAGAGSVNAASGRMIMGWFAAKERGLAMGIRQTAQPAGAAIAALALPPLASRVGPREALLLPAVWCAVSVVAVLLLVLDPPRPTVSAGASPVASPYRSGTSALVRIHAAAALLVVPQFAVATFTLTYLVAERAWTPVGAGRLIFVFQLVGALGRIGSGLWSDRVGSRLRPMRQLAIAACLLMAGLALGAWTGGAWIIVVFGLSALITVADNGLAFVAVAETAGPSWAGRAIGIHNSGQNGVAIATVPPLAAVIEHGSYSAAFALAAVAAFAAALITPVRREKTTAVAVEVSGPSAD